MNTAAIEGALQNHLEYRDNEVERIKLKLQRMARWQRRYDKLTDPSLPLNIRERVNKLSQLLEENHLKITGRAGGCTGPSRAPILTAVYHKEEVTLHLITNLNVSPDGVVSMTFHRSGGWARKPAFRISVGKTTRISNNILATLLERNG